jgi:hypothetical protein
MRLFPRRHRTQILVLVFFGTVWIALVAILLLAPGIYDEILRSSDPVAEVAFVTTITAMILIVGVGVTRRWRWLFWLILIAFLAGAVRVPISVLQLTGVLGTGFPRWYLVLQGFIGLAQVMIGLVMLADYRKAGIWGGLEHTA